MNTHDPRPPDDLSPDLFMTTALPYSNGSLHLGHMLEHIQADAQARHARLHGKRVLFVCADDNHGTPVELKAASLGIAPEKLVERVRAEHERDFARYGISFDHYHQTHSAENRTLCEHVFETLREADYIVEREVAQLFDPEAGRFLSDRHVRGRCPRCDEPDQYGDVCEACGSTYDATELVEPRSALGGAAPETRTSVHYFFRLGRLESFLRDWTRGGTLQPPVAAMLDDWFSAGLRDWDLSRDAPYFGFEIPGAPGKFFYVWLDAPLGYIATLDSYCRQHGGTWRDVWEPGSSTEIHHFVGKDIAYFHTCFWPALLEAAGLRTPTRVFCHGFLTVDGRKMSKSRGTFLTAHDVANQVDPEFVRYYLLSRLDGGVVDIDFDTEAVVARTNADLVGTVVNIASRCWPLLERASARRLANAVPNPERFATVCEHADRVDEDLSRRDSAAAIRRLLAVAADTNRYLNECEPWARTAAPEYVQGVVTQALVHFRAIAIMLQPITPALAARSLSLFHGAVATNVPWSDLRHPPLGHVLEPFVPLLLRAEPMATPATPRNHD